LEANSLWVETIRRSTCGVCAAQKGCGHGLLNRVRDGQRGLVRVLPGEFALSDCRVNDEVQIGIPDDVIVRGSLVVYMLPLFSLLGGALLASRLVPEASDVAAAVGMVVGFAVGVLLVRWHAWRHRDDVRLQPVLAGLPQRASALSNVVQVT
ncbi:MAG: SoxR reducing system RseC family protein, partial [Haliea sp.]|nr:SoxR reducing system RseC family protein [Haliea sp.]